MISRIERLDRAIRLVLSRDENVEHSKKLLSVDEMDLLKSLTKVLYPFYCLSELLCAQKYCSRSMILPSVSLLNASVLNYLNS